MADDGDRGAARVRRAGLADLAAAAGVGVATVDRVVNGRGGVRPATEARVREAAARLGLDRRLPPEPRRRLRLVAVLRRRGSWFYRRLGGALAEAAALLDPAITVYRSYVEDGGGLAEPGALAARVAAEGGRCDGLVVVAPEDPAVEAAVAAVAAAGVPVVALLSDLPGLRGAGGVTYVGIDNRRAGRAAGYLLGRLAGAGAAGPVLCLLGSGAYRGQRERVEGCAAVLGERFPGLGPLLVRETGEDDRAVARAVAEAARAHPDLAGIYNTGGGDEGFVEGLASARRLERPGGTATTVVAVMHELTPASRGALRDALVDAVLDQDPGLQARRALEILLHRHGRLAGDPGPGIVPARIAVAEGLED